MEQNSLHDEIKWLEAQLEAKKQEALASGGVQKEEKEVLRDTIKEVVSNIYSSAPNIGTATDDDAKKKAAELEEKEHEEIIQELVNVAFAKGITHAINIANKMQNPHLLDELHDTLADKYYQKLLDSRKLK